MLAVMVHGDNNDDEAHMARTKNGSILSRFTPVETT